jgi:hypothetical protein
VGHYPLARVQFLVITLFPGFSQDLLSLCVKCDMRTLPDTVAGGVCFYSFLPTAGHDKLNTVDKRVGHVSFPTKSKSSG